MLLVAEPIQGEQETAMLSRIIDAGRIAMADEVRDFGVMRLAPPPDEIHAMMAAQAERVWSRLFRYQKP